MDILKIEDGIKMTSLQLAELTEKEHKNVLADIRDEMQKLENEGGFNELIFQLVDYLDAKGEKRPMYSFGREGAMQIAMRYSAIIRRKVILKLEEMEKAWNTPALVMARALQIANKELEEHKAKVLEYKPKAEYFDALVERNLLTNFRDTAKELKVRPSDFINWLLEKKFVYRDIQGKIKPHAKYTPKLFELKDWASSNKAGNQTLITPTGKETFRLMLSTAKIAQ